MSRSATNSLSEAIAAHLVATSFKALPPIAVHAARRALLDGLGVMLAATGLSAEAGVYGKSLAATGQGPCRILGSGRGADPTGAAFANGALAHALDFGDCFDPGPAHPHAALLPALMALADARPSTNLGEFLCALAIGGDLACRLSLAPLHPFESGGWYPPPLVNLVSSAAASAQFIGLDAGRVVAAMSFALLSGSFPAALKLDRVAPLRGTREAFAARAAVEATILAQAGATGFVDPLGGAGGFFDVYGEGCRPEVLLDQLGERYLGSEVSFKPWPACRGTHAYIEAALELRDRVGTREIRVLSAGVGPIQQMLTHALPPWPEPVGATEAKFSIPFVVSIALIDGEVGLGSFDEAHLCDERIRHFASRVESTPVVGWSREQSASGRLSAGLADGSWHEVEVLEALGTPNRPLTDQALVEKFIDCAGQATNPLTRASSTAIAEGILEGKPELLVSSIFDRLSFPLPTS